MIDIKVRVENARKIITGNESLLDMLDTAAASELFNWGIELASYIARSTEGMDDASAEQNMEPRMKAVRQFMRAIGNWAAGKYTAPSRGELKDKLAEQLKLIAGDRKRVDLGNLLNLVDDKGVSPKQLILKIKDFLAVTG